MKDLLNNLSIWIIFLPLLIGAVFYLRLGRDSRWIFYTVLAATIPQVITAFQVDRGFRNVLYNVYTPLEFIFLFILFLTKFENIFRRKLYLYTMPVYLVLCTFYFLRFSISFKFINELVCVNNLIYVFWLLLFFRDQYSAEDFQLIKQNPFTWYVFGLIIYAPCTMIVFALYYYIAANPHSLLKGLWMIHNVCNILMYIFFSVGLLVSVLQQGSISFITKRYS